MWFYLDLILLLVCGAIIGLERQKEGKSIGARSIMMLMMGAYLFTFIGIKFGSDPTRMAAQVCSAVGFVGTGLIWKNSGNSIHNLTTAILIWVCAALGCLMAVEQGMNVIIITIIIYLILRLKILK